MKKLILFGSFLYICNYASAQTGISVGNARIFFHSQNLKTIEKLYLSNPTDEPTVWQLSIMDWDRDSAGKKRYFPPGSLPYSCAPFITILPSIVTIVPNTTAEVLVSFNPDSNSRKSENSLNAMIMINEADIMVDRRKEKMKQAGVLIKTQIGVHVYFIKDEGIKGIELVDVKHSADSFHRITTTIQNTGLQPLDTKIRLEISNTDTGEEWKIKDRTCATLPGASREEIFDLPQLKKGKYLSLAIVDSGNELPMKVGEVNFIVN